MTLPWSAHQVELLREMGFAVLQAPARVQAPTPPSGDAAAGTAVPVGLARASCGVDIASLLATLGTPHDIATRRAFWRALRPLRKARRTA